MITRATVKNSPELAVLHHDTISRGFLSKLGTGFLQSMYSFLIQNELVLVYKEGNTVLGFVSCAITAGGIMKRFLVSSPAAIFKIIFALLKNPTLIRSLWETYRAPSLSTSGSYESVEIPETELLSISVSPQAQKGGIGTQLLLALEMELAKNGIGKYKVVAGEKLEGANKFYLKNGFHLAKQITIHGSDVSNVYVKEI